jgi:uncharacterized membrane protein YcaP (DUF421 family)
VIRGSLMYLALFIILRFIARRQAGSFGPAHLLVIVLIADASQNALGKDYTSITEGVLLVLTIVAWEYLIDWLAWRFPALRPVLQVPPLQLIADGKTLRENLAREMITEDELRGQLRQRGIGDIGAVQESFLEGDGKLSVLKRDQ